MFGKHTFSPIFYPKVNCDVFMLSLPTLLADINLHIHLMYWGKKVFNYYLTDLGTK